MNEKYCVYLTTYSGNKLPPFYVGSTSVHRVESGYRGSVKSKKYRAIFESELRDNPKLFKTKIVAVFNSRDEALNKEVALQTKLNVVKSGMYINMSIARNFGWFGMRTSKENSPTYGKRWKKTPEQIERSRVACILAFNRPEVKDAMSKRRKGKLPMSKQKIDELVAKYKEIFDLYNVKPQLQHGHKSKNGKIINYERAFANAYHSKFNMTNTGVYQILTMQRIGFKLL